MMAAAYMAYRYVQKSRQRLVAKKNEQLQEKEEQILEKEEQIETLREEKLEMELRARQDELVRSRMNIVRKNEMLQEIKKTALSLNNALPTGTEVKKSELLSTIKRRVTRLIGQIDTNIEHDDDLEAFKSSFDFVHHHFLQILDERYPTLTHKEKMLCAYIRMNLLSKEIAPLLNISTRGVEISRYRIRQKLGLDTKDSLTEFLQHL
jgi:DNA-binding CsgD family transcriptional regulator